MRGTWILSRVSGYSKIRGGVATSLPVWAVFVGEGNASRIQFNFQSEPYESILFRGDDRSCGALVHRHYTWKQRCPYEHGLKLGSKGEALNIAAERAGRGGG